jgi:hypothetical protein
VQFRDDRCCVLRVPPQDVCHSKGNVVFCKKKKKF